MWPPWLSSPSRAQSPSSHTRNFSCSSFKDIQTLINEDNPQPIPGSESQLHRPKKPSIFHRVRISTSVLRAFTTRPPSNPVQSSSKLEPDRPFSHPSTQPIAIIYFTSLRVVRRTFEDCRAVRAILRGFRISIDERDVSMDSSFLQELEGILGIKKVTLPRVFIGGRYVGGADEIRQMHESGELKKLIGRFPMIVGSNACDTCDGHRFIVCEECDGSHKVYVDEIGFRSCTNCNVNGLIRCPSCFSSYDTIMTPDRKF